MSYTSSEDSAANSESFSRQCYNQNNSSTTWQQFVLGAGSAAGSTVAVVSEESMKCLKYCLNWLQYAIQHITEQMNVIRGFLVSLATNNNKNKEQSATLLSSIKQDMVSTLRKVIDIITCYATNALPYQTKATIRGAILNLPIRWASLYDDDDYIKTGNKQKDSKIQQQTKKVIPYKQEDIALRLLAFGQESSTMLNSISTIFEDTIQRAENWLEKLRIIHPLFSSNEVYNKNLLPLSNTSNNHNNDPRIAIKNNMSEKEEIEEDFYNLLLPPITNLQISSSLNNYHTL
ncbi:transcription factor Opi1-domain-containing protein [Cokeromyces recurvatus]|uniref:transcription factor Opi1-domain-containing protein n=1 Tax=Cokeromyces recurvatus TaxID=90255 RepID=UPI00221F3E06|nr:transcription factor Opi1-domain-containing protein [Cokeromyces recurvatus]KAI7906876.1 transcription factor Opi1-domain-containing protein [Cokeromyces recurvatus]